MARARSLSRWPYGELKRAQKTRVNKTKNVSTKTCFIYVSLALAPPRTPSYPLLPPSLALQEQISVMYRKHGM